MNKKKRYTMNLYPNDLNCFVSRPDRSCAISELSNMAHVMGSSLDPSQEAQIDFSTDCDCRQWAFQFLRRPIDLQITTSTTTEKVTTTTTESTTTSTTTTSTTTTTFSTTTTTTTTTESKIEIETRPQSSQGPISLFDFKPRPTHEQPRIRYTPVKVQPINKPKYNDCSNPPEEKGLWRILAIIISALGLAVVLVTLLAEAVTLRRAQKRPKKHEMFLPIGLILLYASIAVIASNHLLNVHICAARRIMPGLGLVAAFTGLILQLIHELDKNVYIVNPERLKKFCGLSKANGLVLLGIILVLVQVILLVSWLGARPPRVLCSASGHLECAALARVEDHYPMVYGYPVLLGLIICGLSGISLKWKTNSGATWNLLALTVTFVAWAVTAAVEALSNHRE